MPEAATILDDMLAGMLSFAVCREIIVKRENDGESPQRTNVSTSQHNVGCTG